MHDAMPISKRAASIPEALSVYFNQLVYELKRMQRDIITLSLGEAFFDIPYFDFKQLDFTRGYHYSHSRGIPELREKIASYYRERYDSAVQADDIIISAGSKIIIFMCLQVILNPGDAVAIHEPAWLSYQEQAHLLDAEVNFIPFDCSYKNFSDYFTASTRVLILNNPNNPSGYTYRADELRYLYEQCRKRNIYLLMDEAYSDFVIDGSFASMANLVPSLDGVIVVNSLSKNMGMSGWRIGYVIASQTFLSTFLKLNQHLITCAPTILQLYLAKYFDDVLSFTLSQVRDVVEKRNRIAKKMDELQLRYLPGNDTFYFFVKTDPYEGDIHDLALYLLLEKGICVVPGEAYGDSTSRFLRISIGAESEERIDLALKTIRDYLHGNIISHDAISAELQRLKLPAFSVRQNHAVLPEIEVNA